MSITPFRQVRETLTRQFGEGKMRSDMIGTSDGNSFREYFEWQTPKQIIYCWMTNTGEKSFYHIGIRAEYRPFAETIDKIVRTEKNRYF